MKRKIKILTLLLSCVMFMANAYIIQASEAEQEKNAAVEEDAAIEHIWNAGEIIVEPTCVEEGEKKYICTICGQSKIEVLEPLGHEWGSWSRVISPTVKTSGKKQRSCIRCNSMETRTIAPLPLKLDAVTLNKPSVVSGDCIKLTWEPVANADGYQIYRKQNGKWDKIKSVKGTVLSYRDKTTKVGVKYQYRIRAFTKTSTGFVFGTFSKKSAAITQSFYKKAITLTSVTALSQKTIQIKWNSRAKATGYIIYRKTTGTAWKKIKTVGQVTSYKDTTCRSAETYFYTVRAYSKNGSSYVYSAYDNEGLAATAKMLKPTVKAVSEQPSTVTITWSRQERVNGYILYRKKKKDDKWTRIKKFSAQTSSYTDRNLIGGTKYQYTVRAYIKSNAKAGIPKTLFSSCNKKVSAVTVVKTRWEKLQDQYRNDKITNQLIFVKYTGGSNAEVEMYQKSGTTWKCILSCDGYVGQNGIDKQIQGDRKTPVGVFDLTGAFGIKKNPGAKMPYVQVNQYIYWCGDELYYNTLVDVRQKPHICRGEHLIDYVPHYNYGMFLNYNPECILRKGSAIFLHCIGYNKYTGGCIAVSESDMIKIIQNAETGAKICIYSK